MVTTTVDKLSETRVKLTIAVSPEELKPSLQQAYKQIAEQVSIPGFRKGKVPPPIIDQRVGREAVIEQAVNDGMNDFFQQAVRAEDLKPIGQPSADVSEWPNADLTSDLQVTVEVDVRPDVQLPKWDGLELTVDAIEVPEADVDEELERLRGRFGTLVTVDRPAKSGDLVTISLQASLDGAVVDSATDVTYEVGSGDLLDGIDEALDALSAGEETTFRSSLLGGDHEGREAEIVLTLSAVKERELPELDDEFAQIASPFDTVDELRANLREQLEAQRKQVQANEARTKAIDALLAAVEVPVPENLIEEEVRSHLESEGKPQDDPHGDEVREAAIRNFKSGVLLDQIVEQEDLKVNQDELSDYVVRSAQQYGMDPNEYIRLLDQQGQLPLALADIARTKAATLVVSKATVIDSNKKQVDLSEWTEDVLHHSHDHGDHDGHDHGDHEGHDHETDAEPAKA